MRPAVLCGRRCFEYRHTLRSHTSPGVTAMAKSQDRKKETKKKPAKTLEEKRAAKREKKQNRGM
jgi:hypothetical protein